MMRLVMLFGLILLNWGCAGASYSLTANQARVPISFSPALINEDGAILYLGEDLEALGSFSVNETKLGFFYASTHGHLDISTVVNSAVKEYGGEGVVKLELVSGDCALNMFWPLTILPFWPGCQNATVSGVVVRRKSNAEGAR